MQNFIDLSKRINTMRTEDSAANSLMRGNVRMPSLVKGCYYILREWTTTHHVNYSNPYSLVEFLGCGTEEQHKAGTYEASNYKVKDMQDKQYYWFRSYATNCDKPELFTFGAYEFERCICICSGAVRVTAYAIEGCDYPEDTAPAKPVKSGVKKERRAAREAVVEDDKEPSLGVYDDSDDEYMLKFAQECHPLSLQPFNKEARRTYARA